MALVVKDKGGADIAPVPTGMHHAVCYGVVDVGTQPAWGKFPARPKVVMLYEFPELRIDLPDKQNEGKKVNLPRALSIKETATLASKGNLRGILENWRGRPFTEQELEGFDLNNVIGANALINVVHEQGRGENAGKTYANISTINPLPKGMKKLTAENPPCFFSFSEYPNTAEIAFPANLPSWIHGLILQSDEYILRSQKGNQAPQNKPEDDPEPVQQDVPF